MIYSSAKLLALVEEAQIGNAPLANLLRPFGLSPEELRDVERMYTLEQVFAVFRALVLYIARADVIFKAGQKFRFADFGIFGLAVMSQQDLRSALGFAMRYRPLASPMIGLDVTEARSEGRLVFKPLPGTETETETYSRLLDFNVGMFLGLISDALGHDEFVARISLSARADALTRDVLDEQGYTINEGEDAICLRSGMLDMPLRQRSVVGSALAKRLCSDALANMGEASQFSAEVQAVIISNIEKPMTAAFVAHRLGIGERSLRRRLSQENISFRDLKCIVQDDIACRYLRETRMSVKDIAAAVGYGDVSNFRRAFRSRHGLAPKDYREKSISFGGDFCPFGRK